MLLEVPQAVYSATLLHGTDNLLLLDHETGFDNL